MPDKPLSDHSSDEDLPQLRRLQDWWLGLPLSYRVNALLYFLGACALVFLLTNLFSGDSKPRQIQVGAGVAATTSTTKVKATTASSGAGNGSSTSTSRPGSTTSAPGVTTTAPGGGGSAGGGSSGGGGGSSGGGGNEGGGGGTGGSGASEKTTPTQPPGGDGTSDTTSPTTAPTTGTTAPPACRNSTEPRCGQFRWDPVPTNQAPVMEISSDVGSLPTYGQNITFSAKVTEPDHGLAGACGTMSFGDGMTDGSCPPPACGTNRYGPWEPSPDPGAPGSRTFTFRHAYTAQSDPKAFIVTFKLESRSDCYDPYGTPYNDSTGTKTTTIVVTVRPS